jgi:AraC-like DNA-binding protein
LNQVTYSRSPALPGVELAAFVIRGAPAPILVDHRYLFGSSEPGVVVAQEPGDVVTVGQRRAEEIRQRALLIEPLLVMTRAAGRARGRLVRGRLGGAAPPTFDALFDAVAQRASAAEQQQRLGAFLDAANAGPSTSPPSPRLTPAVSKARQYLDDRFAEDVHLDDLEAVVGLSRFYLVRRFRAEVGLPPHAYQLARRIDRARALISDGMSLIEVAGRCGFTDQSHLTRHFRRAVGVTPGAYARALGVGRACRPKI